jgi:protein-S-isoprenylcysteine O-methyltransferase Ste14
MSTQREQAAAEFKRMIKWVALAGVLMVVAALVYLRLVGEWSAHAVVATILGVFFSVLLGSGLFALAFFSDKSGHDVSATTKTKRDDDDQS